MTLEHVAYAFVEPGGQSPSCRVHTVSDEIAVYLLDHVDDLMKRFGRGSIPPASFRSSAAGQRFYALREGDEAQFVAAAQELSTRLHTAMDARSKRGFLVAIREIGESPRVAVLKLDVHEEHAAVLHADREGVTLEAVQDLLDIPGELQKGAIVPDPRADSEVIVGDRATEETALYFLRALEIQQVCPARQGGGLVIQAVREISPDNERAVAELIAGYDAPVSPAQLFDDNPTALGRQARDEVLAQLDAQTRPVRLIDPVARPPKGIVTADGITITGPVRFINDRVRWEQRGPSWLIEISVAEEPRRTFQ